jgi:hypothetical protein
MSVGFTPNGSHAPELDALNKMLASLAGTLKTLPVRDEIASKADLAAFQAQIRRTAEPQAKPDSELRSAMNDLLHALRHDVRGGDTLLTTWAKRLAIAAVVGLIGFLGGQLSASRQAEALQRQSERAACGCHGRIAKRGQCNHLPPQQRR